jgi:hypothetical protein
MRGGLLTRWPDTALRGGHMKEVGNEESMLVRLLALQTNTRTALAIRIHVGRVDSQAHRSSDFVYAEQALSFSLISTLITACCQYIDIEDVCLVAR